MNVCVISNPGAPFRECTPKKKAVAWGKMLGVIPTGTICLLQDSFFYEAGRSNRKNGTWIKVRFGLQSGWAKRDYFEESCSRASLQMATQS
jgi:hypothetical protein